MNDPHKSPGDKAELAGMRSPLLLSRDNSSLLVVDVQEKLIPLILDHHRVVWNIDRLIRGADLLGIPVSGTEQYPQGLGRTVLPLRDRLATLTDKTMFSCRECAWLFATLRAENRLNLVIVGIETHVCVQQTALDMQANGFDVFVVGDAVGSRREADAAFALRRMESAGVTLTTTESVLFEWCERSDVSQFKQISQLVREQPPATN